MIPNQMKNPPPKKGSRKPSTPSTSPSPPNPQPALKDLRKLSNHVNLTADRLAMMPGNSWTPPVNTFTYVPNSSKQPSRGDDQKNPGESWTPPVNAFNYVSGKTSQHKSAHDFKQRGNTVHGEKKEEDDEDSDDDGSGTVVPNKPSQWTPAPNASGQSSTIARE